MARDSPTIGRRRFVKLAGATAVAVGLAGCSTNQSGSDGSSSGSSGSTGGSTGGSDGGDSTPTETATPEGVQSFKMAISHFPIISSGVPVMVSFEEGYYEQRNIGVEDITSFAGGGTTIRGVVTGGLPVGGGSAAAVVNAWAAGAPVHLIGGMANTNDIDVLTLPDSGIETIQDLKGKTVGYSNPASASQAMLVMSLKRADGISLDDVTLKAMGGLGESITGVKEGDIDAGWSNVVVSVPQINSGDLKRVFGTWEYAKEIPNTALFAGSSMVQEHGAFFEKMLEAHAQANEFIQSNPGKAAGHWAKYADNVDQSAAKLVIEQNLEMNDNFFGVGWNEGAFQSLEEMMLSVDMIDSAPDWDTVVDQQFIPEDQRIDLP
ncbi:MAG: ABC transporter substrate-binding protein [Haloferacaceae archaeon]